MQHVRIRVSGHGREGEIHPMFGLLTDGDPVDRAAALQWNYTGEALGILHYVEGDPAGFAAAVEGIAAIADYAVEPAGDGACYAYIRDEASQALESVWGPVTAEGLVIVPPIRYRADGWVALSIYGPAAAHRRAFEDTHDLLDVEIEAVGDLASTVDPRSRLSDRQREAVRTAIELGYYEVPREASQADVADAMGCATGTAAEHLQKAEATLARSAFEG